MAPEFRSPESRPRPPRRGLGTKGPSYRENQPQPIHAYLERPDNIPTPLTVTASGRRGGPSTSTL